MKVARLTNGMAAEEFIVSLLNGISDVDSASLLDYPVVPGLQERMAVAGTAALGVHDESGRRLFSLKSAALSVQQVTEIERKIEPNHALGLVSRVVLTSGREAQLPMMDFNCEVSSEAQTEIVRLLKKMGQSRGALLDSGRSFHFYGLTPLDDRDWHVFMGKCLLLTPFVDARYVGHRLIDGFCVLRVGRSARKPGTPTLVEFW